MNILIMYYSKTGNTKMLSDIAQNEILKQGNVYETIEIKNNIKPEYMKYDLVLIGSYCDSNSYPKLVAKILKEISCNKLGIFVTHATYETGIFYDNWAKGCENEYLEICKRNNIEPSGYFHCRSKPSTAIAFFVRMAIIKDKNEWDKYKENMNEYPREKEISRFREYIIKICT